MWYAWGVMPLPIMIGYGIVGTTFGWRMDMTLSILTWVAGWLLLGWFARQEEPVSMLVGLMALWSLIGVGLVLTAAAHPFPADRLERRYLHPWLAGRSYILLGGIVLAIIVVWLRRKRAEWLNGLFRELGGYIALMLLISALLLSLISVSRSSPWMLAVLAFMLGVVVVGGRTAESLSVPANMLQWCLKWQWTFLLIVAPMVALLLHRDLAPILVMLITSMVVLLDFRQKVAVVALLLIAVLVLYVGYWLRQPEYFWDRVGLMFDPWHGTRSHMADALWAIARGGWFGRGLTHYIVVGRDGPRCACDAVNSANAYRHAIPLAKTDSIWALLGEISGILGVLAVLCMAALVAVWLWRETQDAPEWRRRVWFIAALSTWAIHFLFTLGWSVRCAPIMGLAVPFMSAGTFSATLWTLVFVLSIAAAHPSSRESVPTLRIKSPLRFDWMWRPLPLLLPGIYLCLTLWHLIQYGATQRETILQRVFHDRASETTCREAILKGHVVVQNGSVVVQQKRLSADPKRRKRETERLQEWINQKVFQIEPNGTIAIQSSKFNRSEPSGLGRLLRQAAGEGSI